MANVKIAVRAACLKQPFQKALHTVAALGATGVQIDARHDIRPEELSQTGIRQFRKMLEDLNLKVASVAFQTRRGYDASEDLDRRVTATKAAMKFARNLGAAVVVNQVGRVPDNENSREWQTLIEVLSDLGAFAHHTGAFLAAKTGSESGADLARLIRALPEGALLIDLDPGKLITGGFSPAEAITELGPHIQHVTANDGVRDLAQGRGMEVQIGRGAADFPELIGMLEEHSYRGWITIDRRNAEDPAAEIKDAIEFLRNISNS